MIRDILENCIVRSIKPISRECESTILLGSPDYLVWQTIPLLVPIWIVMLSLYFPIRLIYFLFKKYIRRDGFNGC